jgi:sRNA-binding carbon storage regulator CsrA
MLVLARKHHQKTYLDLPDGTRITVETMIGFDGLEKLLIDAPPHVRIRRHDAGLRLAADGWTHAAECACPVCDVKGEKAGARR